MDVVGIAVSRRGFAGAGLVNGSIAIIDLRRWAVTRTSDAHSARLVWTEFSPDGRLLASVGTDGKTVVHEVGTDRDVTVAERGVAAQSIAFHPNGRLLAVGHDDAAVTIADIERRRLVGSPLRGHSRVYGLAFSPDGKLLAVLGSNGKVVLWDVASRLRIGEELPGELDEFGSGVAFSPDGKELLAADSRAILRWNLDPAAWTERACQLAGRNLTRAEWREHVGDEPYRRTCP
jgi:WD40 repeat protein